MTQELGTDPLLASLPDAPEGSKKLGDVIITGLLGRGGMGAVYRGKHALMGVDVAVKVMLPQKGEAAESLLKRFIREARLAAQIDHPNITRVMNVGSEGPLHFIIMEFIDGLSAKALVARRGPLPETEAAKIIHDAASGLGSAFKQVGLIHRDIKPDNIMIRARDGRVKVTDLGLAKEAGSGEKDGLTMSSATMGTPQFMPPEQVEGAARVDHRADVYSLGATFYALLTGKVPFTGDSAYAILHKVVTEIAPDPRAERADLSEASAAIVKKCMSKNPDERFQSHEDLCSALRTVMGSSITSSASLGPVGGDPEGRHWHFSVKGQRGGPVARADLLAMAADGRLSPEDHVWKKGMKDWAKASHVQGLFPARQASAIEADLATPPPAPERTPPPTPGAAEDDVPVASLVSGPGAGSRHSAGRPAAERAEGKAWFAMRGDKRRGPMTLEDLQAMADRGELLPDDDVWKEGMKDWVNAAGSGVVVFTASRIANAPPKPKNQRQQKRPPPPQHGGLPRSSGDRKDPVLAAVLSCLVCGLGQIYNGEVGKGLAMFGGCIGLWLIAMGWVIQIWSVIDAYNVAKATHQ